jgi:hypothetical protein
MWRPVQISSRRSQHQTSLPAFGLSVDPLAVNCGKALSETGAIWPTRLRRRHAK